MNAPDLSAIPDRMARIMLGQALGMAIEALRSSGATAAGGCIVDNPAANQALRTSVTGSHHSVGRALRDWASEHSSLSTVAYAVFTGQSHKVGQAPSRSLVFCASSWGSVDRVWVCSLSTDLELGALKPATPSDAFARVPIGGLN